MSQEKKQGFLSFLRRTISLLQAKLAPLTTFQFVGTLLAINLTLVISTVYVEIFYHIQFYKEGYLMTWLSFAHLGLIALVSWMTFKARAPKEATLGWQAWKRKLWEPQYIWLILAAGFAFLALDEVLMLHEVVDKLIHFVFQIEETSLTDRLDDAIVLLYAAVGLGVLFRYGRELKQYAAALPFLLMGIFATFAMIGLDMLTSERTLVDLMEARPALSQQIYEVVGRIAPQSYLSHFQVHETGKFAFNLMILFEEATKTLAGAFLLASFFQCYRLAVQRAAQIVPLAKPGREEPLPSIARTDAKLETDALA